MSYSESEKTILKTIRQYPRIHHNKLQKASGLPKVTFEKYIKILMKRGKVRSYEFDGKKHYLITTGRDKKGLLTPPMQHDEKIEWQIAWGLEESREFFENMKRSLPAKHIDESDVRFVRLVFEKILSNILAIIIQDSFLDPKKNPHRKFIKEYKKLIKEFFEFIVDKEPIIIKKSKIRLKKTYPPSKKALIRGTQESELESIEVEPQPFAEEIARFYSENEQLGFNDTGFDHIFGVNIELPFSSLILDRVKTKIKK